MPSFTTTMQGIHGRAVLALPTKEPEVLAMASTNALTVGTGRRRQDQAPDLPSPAEAMGG